MKVKHLIWSNECDSEAERCCREAVAEREGKPVAEVTDDEMWQEFYDECEMSLDDETHNLNQPLDGRVLMIASLGLWNGRKSGYRLTDKHNLNAVLTGYCGDYITIGSDGHNIVASDSHHDGVNYYEFREVREDRNIDALLHKLYNGTASRADINRHTRSLHGRVAKIYGW